MSLLVPSAVFLVTYLLIAAPHLRLMPIGRPAAALVGAVAMVALGALTAEAAYAAIDGNTLVLLVALMGLAAYLERAGLFARLSSLAIDSALSPRALLLGLVFVAGGLSALLLNDTVCLFLTPVVCELCVRRGLPLPPYLLALCTSSNIGSAATLVGNPQNILIGSIGPLDFGAYARIVGPAALVALAVNALLLHLCFRKALVSRRTTKSPTIGPPMRLRRTPLVIAALVVVGYALGLHLAFTTLTGLALLIVLERSEPREMFAAIDWPLIVFFAALFVVVGGFAHTGLPARAFVLAAPYLNLHTAPGVASFTGYTAIGSNLFSNVPLVMLLAPLMSQLGSPARGFALLGFISTVAGNLTLLGSVANLIVAERARQHHTLGFFEYLRFGVLSTLLSLAVGVPIICLIE